MLRAATDRLESCCSCFTVSTSIYGKNMKTSDLDVAITKSLKCYSLQKNELLLNSLSCPK